VDTKDLIKAVLLLGMNFMGAPLLALIISRKRFLQRMVFALMCFMTISGFLGPAEWGFTLAFDQNYRGHARGFHFFFSETLAVALILANVFSPRVRTKFFPPGIWLWVLYCLMSMISMINAPNQLYLWMAAVKGFKILLFFIATYNYLREEEDVHFFLKTMSFTMVWEMIVVMKMKYLDGLYQVWGTFEHQNSLCMYTTMIGMVLLATGMGPKHRNSNIYLLGFVASAVIVQSTLSRAGLVIFAGGSAGVIGLSLLQKITPRRLIVVGALGAVACIGLSFTLDTILQRFNDHYNFNSNNDRKLLNKASSNMLRDYPVGIGWNNYGVAINHPFPYRKVMDDFYANIGEYVDRKDNKGISESHYWLLLAESGYQGFLSYIIFISVFLWWSIRGAWTFRREFVGCFSMGVAMGFSVNYAQSLLERVLTQPRNMMLWFILLAATSRIEVWRKNRKKGKIPQSNLTRRQQPARIREHAPATTEVHVGSPAQ
jgi:hypothetical protein